MEEKEVNYKKSLLIALLSVSFLGAITTTRVFASQNQTSVGVQGAQINGTDKIAKTLDARKIPTRKGGKWSGATVRDILCNEKYYGAAAFQKTYTDENFHRKRNYGEVDSFFDPEHHEPIISKNVFDRVREIIDRRATEKNVVSGDGQAEFSICYHSDTPADTLYPAAASAEHLLRL